MGRFAGGTLLLMWRELFTGLDVFASASVSYTLGNGQAVEFPVGPQGQSVPILVLSGSDSDTRYGTHIYAGVRFTAPFGGAHAPKLGAEFTAGSRYLVTITTPTTDLLIRLGVRGRTYDVYAIQPIYQQLFARLSWTMIDHDYAPPIAGALGLVTPLGGTSRAIKRTIHGVNLMLNATF